MLASEVMASVAALLNDPSQYTWTNTVLLPLLQRAYDELIQELESYSTPVMKEVSASTTIPAGTTSLSSISVPITDIVFVKKIEERASGSSDLYDDMTETQWEPNTTKTEYLRYWNWREDDVKFLGATSAREIRIYYLKLHPAISSASSTLAVNGAKLFLSAKTAAIASGLVAGNLDRAQALEMESEKCLHRLLNLQVKSGQGNTVRRRAFRSYR